MLEAGRFDFDPPVTRSSDEEEIITNELAVVRDDLARACWVEGQREGGESESSIGVAE